MRPDLGRLAAEILQIGPSVARALVAALGGAPGRMVYCRKNCGESPMRVLRAAAVIALVTGPTLLTRPTLLTSAAHAQMPNINLIPEASSKTPEEREADEVRDKAYRESLKKIPDAKVSSDPWGNVRTDPPKAAANTSGIPKAAANTPKAVKPKPKPVTIPN
jgi:hypothetical protein